MPMSKLNGSVIPNAAVSDKDTFAFGMAIFTAAGAAMYDALAHKVEKMICPPISSPINFDMPKPTDAAISGISIPNEIILKP